MQRDGNEADLNMFQQLSLSDEMSREWSRQRNRFFADVAERLPNNNVLQSRVAKASFVSITTLSVDEHFPLWSDN